MAAGPFYSVGASVVCSAHEADGFTADAGKNKPLSGEKIGKGKSGAFNRDRTGDLILTMDALYLLSYEGISMLEKYNTIIGVYTSVSTRLTRNVIRQVPIATVSRLLPFHDRKRATRNPAPAASTDPVE